MNEKTEIYTSRKNILMNLKPINDYWNKNFNINQIVHILKRIYKDLKLNSIRAESVDKLLETIDNLSINQALDKYELDDGIYIYTKQIYAHSYSMACSCDMIPRSLHSLYEFIENNNVTENEPLNECEKILVKEMIDKIFIDIKMVLQLEQKYLKSVCVEEFRGFKEKLDDFQLVESKLEEIKIEINTINNEYELINSTLEFLKSKNYLIDNKLLEDHSRLKKQLYRLKKDESSFQKRVEMLSKELCINNLPYLIYGLCSEENKTLIELAEHLDVPPYTFIFFLHTGKIDYCSYEKVCNYYNLDKKREYIKIYCDDMY